MKCFIILAAVVVATSAQLRRIPVRNNDGRYQPQRYQPTVPPPLPVFVSTPAPYAPRPQEYRPVQVNRVASSDAAANIVRFESDSSPDGGFSYAYETDNGIAAEAQGTPRQIPGDGQQPPAVAVVIQGRYSFVTPEGKEVTITYVADENGFQASGDAIPTPPPIPEEILRSLEFNARNGQK